MKQKAALNLRIEDSDLEKLNKLVEDKMQVANNMKMDATGLVLSELLNNSQQVELKCGECGEVDRLNTEIERLKKWEIPDKIGAILLCLLNDPANNFSNLEDVWNYIFKPYWDADVLVPEPEDIDNYIAVKNA